MKSRERLQRIFAGQDIDRPGFKLWGLSLNPALLHPSYQPVYELGLQLTDLFVDASSPFDIHFGSLYADKLRQVTTLTRDGRWLDQTICLDLPGRTIKMVRRDSPVNEPSYIIEHFVKEPQDLRALLDLDYQPYPFDAADYLRAEARVGDRGITFFGLDNAAYAVQRLMGSETFALMCLDERELIREAIAIFAQRTLQQARNAFQAGIRPVFAWVGPELCIPPLVRPAEFEEFVFQPDQRLCDLIHENGGHTWIHCHGRVGKLLSRFIDMGADVLNPLEPPPLGDITLQQAVARVGNKLGLEGNIEIATLLLGDEEKVRQDVATAVAGGWPGGRFILCPSAGYMEYPDPTGLYIRNLTTYLQYGYDCVSKCARS